jgi:hypothetical protein
MTDQNVKPSRRGFFVAAAVGGAAAAAVSALPRITPIEPTAVAPKPVPDKGGGYSLSEHVRRYYKTTLV